MNCTCTRKSIIHNLAQQTCGSILEQFSFWRHFRFKKSEAIEWKHFPDLWNKAWSVRHLTLKKNYSIFKYVYSINIPHFFKIQPNFPFKMILFWENRRDIDALIFHMYLHFYSYIYTKNRNLNEECKTRFFEQ